MVKFTARRSTPELVAPARQTPRDTKALSATDNFPSLRFYIAITEFFKPVRRDPTREIDSAKAIKAAFAEALVYYHPIARRLREMPGGKLAVERTAEGVMFVEADADVGLEDFGVPLLPPYPCVDELLYDAADLAGSVVGKPLA